MIIGQYFITPHAVNQFRRRMAPRMTYEQALGAIIKGLRDNVHSSHLNFNTGATVLRVKGDWQFRAVVKENVVTTILKSGKPKRRGERSGQTLDGSRAKTG
jgi:hypothetical protein